MIKRGAVCRQGEGVNGKARNSLQTRRRREVEERSEGKAQESKSRWLANWRKSWESWLVDRYGLFVDELVIQGTEHFVAENIFIQELSCY